MIKKYNEKYKTTIKNFESISDLVHYLNTNKTTDVFMGNNNAESNEVSARRTRFTKTKNYEEAEELLLHGWDCMAKDLTSRLNVSNEEKTKHKNVYDVVGYQACVPRYLQGIPTNMVRSKQIKTKNKVIVINKNIGYSCATSTETIINESVKCLKAIQSLEAKGYSVELNIVIAIGRTGCGCYDNEWAKLNGLVVRVCIKKASQRLNIKQVAFPLVHPSMLRRIIFKLIEVSTECETGFIRTYGECTHEKHKIYEELYKGQYLLPMVVNEEEITDLEKYKI